MTCKDCIYRKENACTVKHIRVKTKTESCKQYNNMVEKEVDTRTCATCKHHYFPDKTYKNYDLFVSHSGELFMCKCRLDKWAKFVNKNKCKNYERN